MAGPAGLALGVAFGCGPQSPQMRRKVSCWALPSSGAPSTMWLPSPKVPAPWEHWKAALVWEARSTRGSCRPHEAAGHKSLFFASSLTPHSFKNHPLGSQVPGAATPAASSSVSSQTKPDSGLQGQWLQGSAMEMNFDPNCKAPTPYLLFKANPFHRVNITPLFNSHLPPTFQALTFDPS